LLLIIAGYFVRSAATFLFPGREMSASEPRISSIFVSLWHKCEVSTASSDVRVRRQSGRHLLGVSISHFDPNRS
jgi:hypothetical protein